MREVIVTGKTVEDATAKALAELGLAREEVSIEILEMPVRKLFRSTPAKVRATAEGGEEKAENAAKSEPKAEKLVVKAEKPAAVKAEPAVKKEEPSVKAENKAETSVELSVDEIPAEFAEKVKAAMNYLSTIFTAMGAEGLTMTVHQVGEAIIIKVDGDDVGMLIGHRGETMENLSYLASLVANRMPGDYIKLGLDVAGYRSKREKDLQNYARRMAARVAKTGRNYVMDPMNPYERRIIHSTVSEMEGVRSESRGEGADRRVVIYSTDPNARNNADRRSNNRGGRGDKRGSYNRGGERRSSVPAREFADTERPEGAEPVAPKRTQLIDDAEGFALYGKIEL